MTRRITINCDQCQRDLITFYFQSNNDYWIYDLFDIICHGCRDHNKLKSTQKDMHDHDE